MRPLEAMTQSITKTLVVVFCLLLAACGPEAKKKRAMEGGDKYFEKGQYKQARLMYLNAVKADARFGDAYYKLALTNLRLGSYAEAIGNLQRAVDLLPDNMDAHSKLADIYLSVYASNPAKHKNLLKDIRELAAKMEKRGKGTFEEVRMRGYLLLAEEKAEEALAAFNEAEKKKPGDTSVQVSIVRTLLVLNRVDEAMSFANAMIERNKEGASGYELLYGVYVARKDIPGAEKVLERRLANNPKDASNYIRLAAHAAGMKNPEKADQIMAQLAGKRDQFSNALQLVGDFYYRTRNLDRAAQAYQEGMKVDAANSRSYEKRLIEVRVAQNRSQEALEMTEKILKEDPKDPEAIAMRASLWLYAGKPDQINIAVAELQSVVSKMPENFVLRYNLGRALMSKGDLDGARVQFADALRYRADYVPARVALAQVLLARGEYNAALTTAGEILTLDPANQFARLIQSQAYLAQGKFNESRGVLETALKIYPDSPDAIYQLGYVYYREKRYKESEAEFQKLFTRTPPDLRGLMGLSEVYEATGQAERALTLLQSQIDKFPKTSAVKLAWANIAVRAQKYDEGIAMFKSLIAADPRNFDLHMRVAEGLRLKKAIPEAVEYWKKASELMPTHIGPMLFRAMALDESDRRSEAAPLYEQVLKQDPDNVIALNNYSFYLADQGNNLDLALTYAQKAKSKKPDDAMISDTLGYIYLNPHFRFEPRVRISRMLVRINIHRGLKAAKTP
ncbi:MAG: tetratricopeptide repeat protein, partial [Acidobacteria bacterium]|nr:tetratricopeptide repeat protein [Acidobacteriota bacterium]